ncbi:hypothetical protein A3L11_00015 [Thermococcus siculi]|uniref:Transglutaminase-like domain-containing protein n=1 Tax=Thermococcus siculi TaxID=72803 RepID=A0A2Z2MGZ8_9EURY|nr:transglutaminase domain-containing protein [Thermococcus siculi]ASJ07702.1 hypothetical protein A3L11_00015 [Thermococcus siculi]
MVGRKYVAFLTLTLLSFLIASLVLGPALVVVPPNTTPLEDIFSPELPAGNNTTGNLPVEKPYWEGIRLNVTGASHVHYLRARVYSVYVNGEWRTGNVTRVPTNVVAPPEVGVPHHTETDRVWVVLSKPVSGPLFTSLHTVRVDATGVSAIPEYNLFEGLNVTSYGFTAVRYTFDVPYLLNLTAGNLTDYMNAPADEALVNLARRITAGATSDYERALLIEEYLRGNFQLNENATPPGGADRLHWFLFQSKEGTSYDFATAFAILARLNGLPSRLVEGFYINATPEEQTVTEKNRSYWVEVYFEGAGWLTFDPLHPDTNVFRPFELHVDTKELTLGPNESASVKVRFWDVWGENATLRVMDWEGRELFKTGEAGTFEVPVGPFGKPGSYVVLINASTSDGSNAVGAVRVNVRDNVSIAPELSVVGVRVNSPTWVNIKFAGFRPDNVSTDSPLVDNVIYTGPASTKPPAGVILLKIAPKPGDKLGWHMVRVDVSNGSRTYPVVLPVFVYDSAIPRGDVPEKLLAGSKLTVSGTVRGRESNSPAENGYVYASIVSRRFILLGVGNVSDGKFTLNLTLPRYLRAGLSSIDLQYVPRAGGPLMPSYTSELVRIIGLSEIRVPERILAPPGNVTIAGSLTTAGGEALANATVTYSIDGKPAGSVNTSTDGTFRVEISVGGIEEHTVEFRYAGGDYYTESSAKTEVRTVLLMVPGNINATLGAPVTVSGRLLGVENATIKAYIFPDREYEVEVSNGSFSLFIEPFLNPGERTLEFRFGAYILGRMGITVISPVRLELLDERVEGETTVPIRVKALNSLGEPLSGARLAVSVENVTAIVTTNASGVAVVEVPVPEESLNTSVTVTFEGAGYYLPANETFYVVISRKRKIPWLYIGIAVLIGGLILRYYLVRRGREEAPRGRALKIIFTGGIPVFREGEKVEISVECDETPELYVDGKPVGKGREFQLVLPAGEHVVEARCGESVERAGVKVVREYDEAVVDYYERCFLRWAGRELEVERMTPREIAKELMDRMYPWEPLEAITEIFERAKYSTVGLSRGEFLRFYRSLLELVGGECLV